MPKKTLGQLLWQLRDDEQLSLRAAAELSGVSHSSINQLENDQVDDPSIISLRKLAKAYKIPFTELTAAWNAHNGR